MRAMGERTCQPPDDRCRIGATACRRKRAVRIATVAIGVLITSQRAAHAHFGEPSSEHLWKAWNRDPVMLLTLGLFAWLSIRGLMRFRQATGRRVSPARRAALIGAFAALAIALLSPLDALSAELGSAHMIQHLFLMSVAAPLLVIAGSESLLLWSLPKAARKSAGRVIRFLNAWPRGRRLFSQPFAVWMLHAVILWAWHLPVLYRAALRHPIVHDVQHLSFFAAAYLFWRVLLDPASRMRLERGAGVLYLFTTSLHASALGVLMTFAPRPWYTEYLETAPRWGLTPLEDQQLAGLIMWVPGCTIYAAVAAALFVLWLESVGHQSASVPERRH